MKTYIKSAVRITDQDVLVDGKKIDIQRQEGETWLVNIYRSLGIQAPKFFKMDNLCKSGFLAAELAMKECNQQVENPKKDWSVILLNHASSLDNDRAYQETIQDADNYFPSPAVFVYTLANIVTGEIAIRHKIMGESSFFVQDKFSPSTLKDLAESGFAPSKEINNMLCGWVEYENNHCDVMLFALSLEGEKNDDEWDEHNINKYYQIEG